MTRAAFVKKTDQPEGERRGASEPSWVLRKIEAPRRVPIRSIGILSP